MISFYQVDESGGTSAVTLGEASEGFAIQDQYHEDVLTSNLDFDTVVDAGIYRYESIGDSSQHVPSDASSGYVFVFAESDKHSTRSIVQIAFDDNGGVLVRRGAISEDTGTTIGAWEDLNASGSSTFAISSTSPAGTVGGSWSVVSGYEDVGIWKQVNIIMTLADAVNTTILLDVATFALSGTQTIYVSNGDGTFSPLLLDIINGGTGANSAAGARTALGAASQADLNSLRDSVNNIKYVQLGSMGNITQAIVSQQLRADPDLPQLWRLSMYGDGGAYMLIATEESLGLYNITTESSVWRGVPMKLEHHSERVTPSPDSFTNYTRYFSNTYKHAPVVSLNVASSFNSEGVNWANGISYSIQTITSEYFTFQIQNTNSVSGQPVTMRWEVIGY